MTLRRILIIAVASICAFAAQGRSVTDSLMSELEQVIANREVYLDRKRQAIDRATATLARAVDDSARFRALTGLFDRYYNFNVDSAYGITLRMEAVARRLACRECMDRVRLNRADVLGATGMYHESLAILDSISSAGLPAYLLPYYYHIRRTVYGRLADYSVFDADKRAYLMITDRYRDSIMAVNPPGSFTYAVTKADRLNVKGKPEEAIRMIKGFMKSRTLDEHEKAVCAWTLADSYKLTGDLAKRKEMLLQSSIADLKSSVREYLSLRELALLFYHEGDVNRAYELMNIAQDDATKCKARQRIIELNSVYPEINAIYVEKVTSQKRALTITIIIITVLSLLMLAMLVHILRQMKRIDKARRETEQAYRSLNLASGQLRAANDSLTRANSEIADISRLKEAYIARYMDQCVSYIDQLDSYRKSIGRLVSLGKTADLKKQLSSTDVVDRQLKEFYAGFDTTFLSLFPTFVEDFNRLLLPDEAIVPKKEGTLNTELRIFALIRLGITDSDRIARFLRYSLTTIYNYRTRTRNKARGDRNMLEQQVMSIGLS